ncbi:lachesin-like [Antedon mediterranea]|uniref:lachesin-like n=1 Tax=Antedon mediterranea TaxID=105859 RepID=UPI003AF79628
MYVLGIGMPFGTWVVLYLLMFQRICSLSGFIKEPADENQAEGDLTYFNCIVRGLDETHYVSWLHNGRKISKNYDIISDNNRYSIEFDSNSRKYNFEIENTQRQDKGEYVCAVYDSSDSIVVKSRTANLTVSEIPQEPYPLCHNAKLSYSAGQSVLLSCISEKTSPLAHLKWRHSNIDVTTGLSEDTSSGNYKVSYSFIARQSNNRAIFICELTTSVNPIIRRNCSIGPINVLYAPVVRIEQTSDVILGNEAIFICYSDANPKEATYQWSFDPPIDETMYYLENEFILRIKNTVNSLNGIQVICKVTNSIGSESNKLIIKVKTRGDMPDNEDVEYDKTFEENIDISDSKMVNKNQQLLRTRSPTINNSNTNSDISISLVVIIAVVCIIVILGLALIPVGYMRYTRRQPSDIINRGRPVSIPDVYFEPRDHIDPMLPQLGLAAPWMRTVGVQVPGECEYDVTYNTQVMPQLRQVYYSQRMYPAASL